jgi:hypothetical protein
MNSAEFQEEFDQLWTKLMSDEAELRKIAGPDAPVLQLKEKPRQEIVQITPVGAGATGFEQIILELGPQIGRMILDSAVKAIIPLAINWIIQRMKRGRPDNVITPTNSTGRSN